MPYAFQEGNIDLKFGDGLGFSGSALVKSVQINTQNHYDDVMSLGSREIQRIPLQQEITATVKFIINPESAKWLFGNEEVCKKISEKQVKDCTPEELLFAVREKVKKK